MIDLKEVGKGHPSEHMYLQPVYELVKEVNAVRVVEIGSGKFVFSRAILKALEETGGHLHTCDPNIVPHYLHDRMSFYPLPSNEMAEIWHKPIDFLMIDGDHSKEQVFKDYYNFEKFVRSPGFIVFHDINIPHGKGITQLWEHLKKSCKVRLEITSWPGLGVLQR